MLPTKKGTTICPKFQDTFRHLTTKGGLKIMTAMISVTRLTNTAYTRTSTACIETQARGNSKTFEVNTKIRVVTVSGDLTRYDQTNSFAWRGARFGRRAFSFWTVFPGAQPSRTHTRVGFAGLSLLASGSARIARHLSVRYPCRSRDIPKCSSQHLWRRRRPVVSGYRTANWVLAIRRG